MLPAERRTLLLGAASLAATLWAAPRRAWSQTATPPGPFTLPPLPYAPGANEPFVDAQTMELHHDRHHAAYVTNLNAALKDHGQLAALPLEELLARLHEVPDAIRTAVRNNAGGHANHSMFWPVMGGAKAGHGGGGPGGELAAAVDRDLGGSDRMKGEFNRLGAGVFGSGWVFVTVDRAGKLALVTHPNQDTPLMDGQRVLFGNDVWEHAYYLKYQNRRPEYLAAWWNVVNWEQVAARYAQARQGTLKV